MIPNHLVGLAESYRDSEESNYDPLIDAFLELGMLACAEHYRDPKLLRSHSNCDCDIFAVLCGGRNPENITLPSSFHDFYFQTHWQQVKWELQSLLIKGRV